MDCHHGSSSYRPKKGSSNVSMAHLPLPLGDDFDGVPCVLPGGTGQSSSEAKFTWEDLWRPLYVSMAAEKSSTAAASGKLTPSTKRQQQ